MLTGTYEARLERASAFLGLCDEVCDEVCVVTTPSRRRRKVGLTIGCCDELLTVGRETFWSGLPMTIGTNSVSCRHLCDV